MAESGTDVVHPRPHGTGGQGDPQHEEHGTQVPHDGDGSAPLLFRCVGCGSRLTTVDGRAGAREVDSVSAPHDETARQLMRRHTEARCRAYRAANGEGSRG